LFSCSLQGFCSEKTPGSLPTTALGQRDYPAL
jgi:hypothetical protein